MGDDDARSFLPDEVALAKAGDRDRAEKDQRAMLEKPELARAIADLKEHLPPGQAPFRTVEVKRRLRPAEPSEKVEYVPPTTIPPVNKPHHVTNSRIRIADEVRGDAIDPRKAKTDPRRGERTAYAQTVRSLRRPSAATEASADAGAADSGALPGATDEDAGASASVDRRRRAIAWAVAFALVGLGAIGILAARSALHARAETGAAATGEPGSATANLSAALTVVPAAVPTGAPSDVATTAAAAPVVREPPPLRDGPAPRATQPARRAPAAAHVPASSGAAPVAAPPTAATPQPTSKPIRILGSEDR